MSYLLFDVILLIILAAYTLRGAAKGFVLSLFSVLAMAAAFLVASFASQALAPKVAQALEPKFAVIIEEKLTEQIAAGAQGDAPQPATPQEVPLQEVLNVLKELGFYEGLVDTVNRAVEQGMLTVAAGAAAAVAAAIAQSVASFLIFSVVFMLVMAAWSILSRTLNLVTRLPGLNVLNKTAGAALGLIKGCAVLFVAVCLIQYLGHIIPEETVQKTHLLRFFMTQNPVIYLLERF